MLQEHEMCRGRAALTLSSTPRVCQGRSGYLSGMGRVGICWGARCPRRMGGCVCRGHVGKPPCGRDELEPHTLRHCAPEASGTIVLDARGIVQAVRMHLPQKSKRGSRVGDRRRVLPRFFLQCRLAKAFNELRDSARLHKAGKLSRKARWHHLNCSAILPEADRPRVPVTDADRASAPKSVPDGVFTLAGTSFSLGTAALDSFRSDRREGWCAPKADDWTLLAWRSQQPIRVGLPLHVSGCIRRIVPRLASFPRRLGGPRCRWPGLLVHGCDICRHCPPRLSP